MLEDFYQDTSANDSNNCKDVVFFFQVLVKASPVRTMARVNQKHCLSKGTAVTAQPASQRDASLTLGSVGAMTSRTKASVS